MKVYTSLEAFKNVENPIVTTGTFDGVHIGHQKIIAHINNIATANQGESVLLTFFPHPRMVLFPDDDGIELITSQSEKIDRLKQAGLQHLIIHPFTKEFSRTTYVEYVRDLLVNGIGVKQLVIGYDHQFGRNREGSFEQLEELAPVYDFEVKEIPVQTVDDVNISSTKIRKAIKRGDVRTVTKYLGYRFQLTGMVVKGNQMGRRLGFPTANLKLTESYKITPGNGVYAVRVKHNLIWHNGVMNIGKRPTVTSDSKATIEVHIFDFNANIYGDLLTIELVEKIRDEQKFNSAQDLSQKIQEDKLMAINILH